MKIKNLLKKAGMTLLAGTLAFGMTSQVMAGNGDIFGTERQANNEIVVAITTDIDDTMNPYMLTSADTRQVMLNLFEGLVKLSPDGSYIPAGAEAVEVSEDGLTYTFTLRDGLKFHNGEDVTTDDVIYSINTAAEISTTSSIVEALKDITVTADGNQIVITLAAPNPDFLAYISSVYLSPEGYEDQATSPIGTGPYKFVSRSVQENIIFEKFDEYYDAENVSIDKVTFKVFTDANARLTALQSGAVDVSPHLTDAMQVSILENDFDVLSGTMNLAIALYLNNDYEPLKDEKVRQALAYAIDVDEVMLLASTDSGVKIGSSMFPNFTKYYDESLADNYAKDTEMAKSLLAEAGYANGFDLTITYASEYEEPYGLMAQAIQAQLSEIGVNVIINPIEWSSWLSDVYQGRDFQSTIVGFDASVLTASALLKRWTSTDGKNMINFSNEEYDKTFAAAQATYDDAEATALYKRCLEILSETCANVYIQDMGEFTVVNPNLEGYTTYPVYFIDISKLSYK